MKSIACVFFLALLSCNDHRTLDRDAYIHHVEQEDKGLTIKKTLDDVDYSLTLCPLDYVIAKEFRTDKVARTNYEKRRLDLEGFIYFKLSLSPKDRKEEVILHRANNEQVVKERLEYLSYGFEENIFTIRNNKRDTLPVSMYHFERTYGVTPNLEFLFSFKTDSLAGKNDKHIQVIIDDIVFNNTALTYEFDKEAFIHAPKLKLY